MNQVKDDEIDFYELFQAVWDGKWIISTFVSIAILLCGAYLLVKDAVYESKLFLSVDGSVPLIGRTVNLKPFEQKFYIDFQKKFYSEKLFEEWKENNSNTSLVFEDFNMTEVVDGFVFSKRKADQLATFELKRAGNTFILVKSNLLPLVIDVFRYSNYINETLKREYLLEAKNDLENIKLMFDTGAAADGDALETILSLRRFIDAAEKGSNVLVIKSPSMPINVSHKFLKLTMSAVLGGMVGVFFIFFRNAIKRRKEQLAKP